MLVGAYLPPEKSPYYEETDIYNGVSLLEDCLLDLTRVCGDIPFIICGDLNARTASMNARDVDPIDDIYEMNSDNHSESRTPVDNDTRRTSKDNTVNSFGRYLIGICEEFGLSILNGLQSLNFSGDFTYISQTGCSLVDYFMISASMLSKCRRFNVIPMVESKHLAVEMSIVTVNNYVTVKGTVPKAFSVVKYKWDEEKSVNFANMMQTSHVQALLDEAESLIDCDINQALSKFNECFEYAGDCMKKTIFIGSEKRKIWFDLECRESRKNLRQRLRRFCKSNCDKDRLSYSQKRREYKELLRQKKRSHKNNILHSLQAYIKDPKKFWDTVRSVRPKSGGHSAVTSEEWYNYFSSIFNSLPSEPEPIAEDLGDAAFADNEMNCETLNQPITVDEIKTAIRALKDQKAAGPDGLIGESYKNSTVHILPFLVKFFNFIFDHGLFPDEWSLAILHPLHKKGDINVPDNYRGISLLNICSKLYSFVLNKRITKWIDDNEIIGEEQAGFRQERSTFDHIFTLLALIQKQLLRHRKLYVAFIDFRKAFDTICRTKLWTVLHKNGLRGKIAIALQSMYAIVKVRVRAGGELTDVFLCPRGLKQGEVCSPVLFSLFINELTKDIIESGKHGIQLAPDLIELLILLFADDVVLLSDSVFGLQTQLNILFNTAKRLDLIVNLDKSNIVVFRNGGHLALNEKWYFGNEKLEVVNMYKYLGVYFTTRLTFSPTLNDLADRARKGMLAIMKLLWSIGEHSPEIFFKMFDCQIQPILTYGSEVWGLSDNQESIERVHLSALKRFLGVNSKSPRHLIYGETGRHPLFVNTYARCIKFWLRLTCMDDGRYPRKAYNMLLNLQRQNYTTWACKVRNVLYKFGFGVVWEMQGVGNVNLFIKEFKLRLIDCFIQDWHAALGSHDFYNVYSNFNQSLVLSQYLRTLNNISVRRVFTRFRIGMSALKCHYLQYRSFARDRDINCPFCNTPETEVHFLLVCPKYTALRNELIPPKYHRQPSMFKFSLLLASTNAPTIDKLSAFVFKALNTRKLNLSPSLDP